MKNTCFKCFIEKPLEDFYKHPQMKDGTVNKCKDCNKVDIKGNYLDNIQDPNFIEKERTRGRRKYYRLYTGKYKSNPESSKKWCIKYPEKALAQSYSQHLPKPFLDAEKHHWSYNEEHYKDVIWLIKKFHMKAHRFIRYDQAFKKYRRVDTNELLNTKEEHENFIRICIDFKED